MNMQCSFASQGIALASCSGGSSVVKRASGTGRMGEPGLRGYMQWFRLVGELTWEDPIRSPKPYLALLCLY